VIDIDTIDFTLSTLDHLDEQFSAYGFVDPSPSPLLPEDDDNYLADVQADLLDVSFQDATSLCTDVNDISFLSSAVLHDDATAHL
jgi:hypothetical protein